MLCLLNVEIDTVCSSRKHKHMLGIKTRSALSARANITRAAYKIRDKLVSLHLTIFYGGQLNRALEGLKYIIIVVHNGELLKSSSA